MQRATLKKKYEVTSKVYDFEVWPGLPVCLAVRPEQETPPLSRSQSPRPGGAMAEHLRDPSKCLSSRGLTFLSSSYNVLK